MVKNITILDIHSYKELKEKKVVNQTLMELAEAFEVYEKPITAKLQYMERDRFFRIIKKYLAKEGDIYCFVTDCRGFFLDIIKLAPQFYSELDQLIGFQLLNLGTLELKIEANPPELVLLYDLVEEFYYDIEERTDSGVSTGISEAEEQEFYESLQKLFQAVQKSEDLSS